jgi:uncharacterized protein
MSDQKFQFSKTTGGAALHIKVVPRASKNEIVGIGSDGALKVRVTAAPVDGAANEAIIKLLSDALHIPKSNIDIVAGLTSTSKLVSLLGINPAKVDEILKAVNDETQKKKK